MSLVDLPESALVNYRSVASNSSSVGEPPYHSVNLSTCIPTAYFRWKRFAELGVTLVLLALVFPILAVVSAIILLTEGRPIFYRQVRTGRNGSRFFIWKFRTMVQNAEKATGPVWSSQSDCRVTKIGRWLRASHLDELPQIFNVLAGHMHLVGPRPERPEFVSGLSRDIRGYDRRHLVRPGITGLAQVKQGYDSCIGDVAKKVELDLVYVQTASLALDLKILFLTAPFIIGEVWSVALRKLRAQEREPAIVVPPIQSTKSELGPEFQIQLDIEDLLNTAPSTKSVVPKPKLTGISARERRASPRRDGVKETEKTTEG